jgi:hypothetical protein
MGVGYSPKIVTDGLILCLDAANPKSYSRSGTSWRDVSNNVNNFQLNNTTFNTANGGTFTFNGTNSYASLASNSIFNFGTGDFSVSFWINSFGQNNLYPAIFSPSNGWYTNTFKISMVAGAIQNVGFEHNGGSGFTSTFSLIFNNWYHVVIFRSSGIFYMYINGILNRTTADSNPVNFADGSTVIGGGNWDGVNSYFNGALNDFCVYNRALSQTEILQNYNTLKRRFNL